ncbi:MAG TPA: polysaccharide biosynthesis C-terminal domain-containing protein [Mycobacteriales bacterium]|nr:polysaccharide biosynthesis C-terminal domain-containing protein [Mycobacteriales bacterium]
MSSTAGLIIARALGPVGRGEYAATVSWFWVLLIVGEVGLTASACYYVAADERRASDYVATARSLILAFGGPTMILALALAPELAQHKGDLTFAYLAMFATALPSFLGAAFTFGLQAASINDWNVVRLSQPLAFLTSVGAMYAADDLTFRHVVLAWAACICFQSGLGYLYARRRGLAHGRVSPELRRPLLRYGGGQLATTIPLTINMQVDQIVLSLAASLGDLGQYAVAVSLTGLALPAVTAIGNVAFPKVARHSSSSRGELERRATIGAYLLAASIIIPVALTSIWAVPWLFGQSYRPAVQMVWILAPGAICFAVNAVISDVLRGHNHVASIARAQIAGAVVTILLLALLVPALAARGAAIASTASYALVNVMLVRELRRVLSSAEIRGSVAPGRREEDGRADS